MVKTEGIFLDLENLKILSCVVRNLWVVQRFHMFKTWCFLHRFPAISEIVKRLVSGAHSKKMVKQIIVVHNKLIIYNEDQFDMVLCKNLEDAQRLHHTLAKIAKKQKIKSLMFMGTASKVMVGLLYDLIVERTGWDIKKVRRRSTRP